MTAPDDTPERVFIWLDEDGVRCSPRHRTFKAALSYFKDQETYWTREDGRNINVQRDRSQYPSQKRPVTLQVGEYMLRDLEPTEQTKLDQVRALMEEGLV